MRLTRKRRAELIAILKASAYGVQKHGDNFRRIQYPIVTCTDGRGKITGHFSDAERRALEREGLITAPVQEWYHQNQMATPYTSYYLPQLPEDIEHGKQS